MRKLLFALACLALCASPAFADVLVTNHSQTWVQISHNTFGLPASVPGCGSENETTCEEVGQFYFNTKFASSGLYNMYDQDGSIGDQIAFYNSPLNGGNGIVTFASDPIVTLQDGGAYLCTEGFNGCIASFTITTVDGTVITLTAASDGENVFDPFGLGADTSDQLQVTGGATIVPEPGTMALLGTGLLGFGLRRRRK